MEEWKAYLQFIANTANQLHNNNLILTVAVHPGQYLPPDVCQKVDRVNVMTYDMIGSRNGKPKHHAELTPVQGAIQAFIDRGCPPAKLVLGIPAYARHEENPGLVKTYSEIMDEYFAKDSANNKYQSMSSMNGYHFDSPDNVRSKVRYAKKVGLGGVFYWELGQDKQYSGHDGGILLQAAAFASTDSADDEL